MKKTKKIPLAFLSVLLFSCSTNNVVLDDSNKADNISADTIGQSENEKILEVTKDNFINFPISDTSLFHGYVDDEGYILSGVYSDDDSIEIPKVLVIPSEIDGEPVVEIEKYAFTYHCGECEAIVLPDTVKYIDYSAFSGLTKLKYVYLGSGLLSIGEMAFNNCDSLEEIYFPDGMETMCFCFPLGENIKDVWIPASVIDMPNGGISNPKTNPNMVIHTPSGSYAESVAIENELPVINDYR